MFYLDDFETLIQNKYADSEMKISKIRATDKNTGKDAIDLKIEVNNLGILESIQQEVFNYGRLLRGEINWARLTDDPLLQSRLELNTKITELKLEMQAQQLAAFTNMQNMLRTSIADVATDLAQQFKTNLLPSGPSTVKRADFIITLYNGQRATVDTEKIVYIFKPSEDYPIIYLNDGSTMEVDEVMSNLAARLSGIRPTIISTHKNFIVNLTYVVRRKKDGNVYKVFTKPYPKTELLVGQNHKTRFNDSILEYGIFLDAEEV